MFRTGRRRVEGHTGGFVRISLFAAFLVFLTATVFAQDLPKTIRGYKVHQETIGISVGGQETSAQANLTIGDPDVAEAGLTGVTLELPAEILSAKQSGKIEMLTFRDIKVNGIAVVVEEYRHPFEFRKGQPASIPKPVRIFLPISGIVRAAWNEMRDSAEDWKVKGRVFVFGRFRRFGIYHKRVVPLDFEIRIKNPLRND